MGANSKQVVERVAREFLRRSHGEAYAAYHWQDIAIEITDALMQLEPGDELPNGLIVCRKPNNPE